MKKVEYEEADWRVCRELRELALERFCEGILGEIRDLTEKGGNSHERYREIYDLIHRRDKQMAAAFDDVRRSRMHEHLILICNLGLLTSKEVAGFSETTQVRVRKFVVNEPDRKSIAGT